MLVVAVFLAALLFVQSAVSVCPNTASNVFGAELNSFLSTRDRNFFSSDYAVASSNAGAYLFVQAKGLVLRYTLNSSTGAALNVQPVRFGTFPGTYPNNSLVSGLCNPTRRAVCEPYALSVDSNDRLWIADGYLRRVTRWDNAANATATFPRPSQVYGVNRWTATGVPRNVTTTTPSNFNSPWYALYQQSADALWVIDRFGDGASGNAPSRLLRFDGVQTRGTFGGEASAYFGVSSFTQVLAPLSAGIYAGYLTADTLGSLYVSDDNANHVLVYRNSGSKLSGATYDLVIGQVLNSTVLKASSLTLYSPGGLTYDSNNDVLYIADYGNNRVVGIKGINSVTTNQPTFTYVLGQPGFLSHSANRGNSEPAANSLSSPLDVNYNAATNTLFVADFANNRDVSYRCAADPSPTNSRSPSLAASPTHSPTLPPSVTRSLSSSPSVASSQAGTTGVSAFKRRFRERRQYF